MVNKLKSEINEDSGHVKTSHIVLSLITIMVIGFILRFYHFPYDLPMIGDGLDYFSYAYEMSQVGDFPKNWALSNNGWPSFVSIIFSLADSDSFSQNIMIQRLTSISISVLSAIPIFLLCNRFFHRIYSLIGAAIFIFEPRMIINSTLGLIEPIYIMIFTFFLFFFLSKNKNSIYISCILVGILAILRWEGLLLIFGVIGLFVIRNRHTKKQFLKLFFGLTLFFIVILPISYINMENTGDDGLISPLLTYGPGYITDYQYDEYLDDAGSGNRVFQLIKNCIENTSKFFAISMIPIFIIFFPFGIFIIIKKSMHRKLTSKKIDILVFTVVVLLPILYAFSRNFEDIRYLYVLFPIFCIISLVSIRQILKQIKHEKLISSLIIASILVISIIYLEIYVQDDYKLEKERYEISKFLVENTNGVNWSSHTKYFKAAKIENDWPSIPPPNDSGHIFLKMKKFGYDEFSTLIDFIKKNEEKGLTHLTVEDMQDWQTFPDLYNNSEEYPFLEQIYDSKKNQLISKVKIFRINYEVFHQFFV